MRRTYYDHEPAYRRIAAAGGRGWDDLAPGSAAGSYDALRGFLRSGLCPARPAGVRAIDLGCGGGQASIRLARAGFSTVGVDFSETAVQMAAANARAEGLAIDFHVGDCLRMPEFDDCSFDVAVDNHTLHCIIGPDRARFLAEVARILRPGGVLFSETMSAEGTPDFRALGVDPVARIDAHRTRYWVRLPELMSELAAAGLEPISVRAAPQREVPDPGAVLVTVSTRRA